MFLQREHTASCDRVWKNKQQESWKAEVFTHESYHALQDLWNLKDYFFFFPISNNSGSLISCGPFGDTSVVSDTSSRDEKLQKHLLDVFFSMVFLKEYYMLILA